MHFRVIALEGRTDTGAGHTSRSRRLNYLRGYLPFSLARCKRKQLNSQRQIRAMDLEGKLCSSRFQANTNGAQRGLAKLGAAWAPTLLQVAANAPRT